MCFLVPVFSRIIKDYRIIYTLKKTILVNENDNDNDRKQFDYDFKTLLNNQEEESLHIITVIMDYHQALSFLLCFSTRYR